MNTNITIQVEVNLSESTQAFLTSLLQSISTPAASAMPAKAKREKKEAAVSKEEIVEANAAEQVKSGTPFYGTHNPDNPEPDTAGVSPTPPAPATNITLDDVIALAIKAKEAGVSVEKRKAVLDAHGIDKFSNTPTDKYDSVYTSLNELINHA